MIVDKFISIFQSISTLLMRSASSFLAIYVEEIDTKKMLFFVQFFQPLHQIYRITGCGYIFLNDMFHYF